jgi:CheY-like chemotaxis protein
MKVLLADDDPDQLTIRSMLLTAYGFETVQAGDYVAAMQMAIEERPDCAVVDLRFPTEELGLRTVRELKTVYPRMHVLLLTGVRSERLAQLPEIAMVDDVLAKGDCSAELIQKLQLMRAEAGQLRPRLW